MTHIVVLHVAIIVYIWIDIGILHTHMKLIEL